MGLDEMLHRLKGILCLYTYRAVLHFRNAFLLFCRAAGLTARYIYDRNDHVWTEIWSEALGRWVHADSCEAAWDKPLLVSVLLTGV